MNLSLTIERDSSRKARLAVLLERCLHIYMLQRALKCARFPARKMGMQLPSGAFARVIWHCDCETLPGARRARLEGGLPAGERDCF